MYLVKQMEKCTEIEYVEKQGSMNKRRVFHKKKRHTPSQIILYLHTNSRNTVMLNCKYVVHVWNKKTSKTDRELDCHHLFVRSHDTQHLYRTLLTPPWCSTVHHAVQYLVCCKSLSQFINLHDSNNLIGGAGGSDIKFYT